MSQGISRRRVLVSSIAAASVTAPVHQALAQDGVLPLTPACGDGDPPTPSQTAGPFYTPDSPLKRDFRLDGPPGEAVLLSGFVVTRRCLPLAGGTVELWHADVSGSYDNRGTRFRGYQITDGDGRFHFATVRPGIYPGRTRHYHVKVTPRGGKTLTTQLYFPDEPLNSRDSIFDPALLMTTAQANEGIAARFDFVMDET